ncbi:hypothetical protein AB0G20_21685 [Streptomyces sp. NPDC024017]|uniref:hypothetical protein n=1 Tax=Streptomyces sp. NPDC024017 TaxID=3154326 RepID=UPI0033C32851
MEGQVGHALFSREPGCIALTSAGRESLPPARHALNGLADGLAAARDAGSSRVGLLLPRALGRRA